MAENVIKIGGRLHSSAQGNVLTGANEIYDDEKQKKQSVINAEVDESLANLQEGLDGIHIPTTVDELSDATDYAKKTDLQSAISDMEGQIPQKVSDLTNDSEFQTSSQVDAKVAAAAVNDVNVSVDNTAPAGQPSAEKTYQNGVLEITFKNIKGEKGDPLTWNDLTDIQKASLQGKQGASAVFDPNTGNILATLHNEIGGDDANSMTQKAITEKILPAVNGNINCPAVIADKCINLYGKASSSASTTGHGITDFIPLEEGCTGLHIVSGAWQNAWSARYIFFYSDASEEDEYCIDGVRYETESSEVANVDVVVPAGARYYRLSTKTTSDPAVVFYKGSLVKGLEDLQADSVAKAAAISQNSEDIANVDAKADGILSYDEEVFTLTAEDGPIGKSGAKGTLGTGCSSMPFQVHAGDTIFYHGYVADLWAAIAKVEISGGTTTYTMLVQGTTNSSTPYDYVYEVQEDMMVVFSGYTSKVSLASAKRAKINSGYAKYLAEKSQSSVSGILQCSEGNLTLSNEGSAISQKGVPQTGTIGFRSNVFHLQANDIIIYMGYVHNSMSAIAKVETVDGATVYTPIEIGKGGSNISNVYTYIAKEDVDVIFSGYSSKIADSWVKKISNVSGIAALYAEVAAQAVAREMQVKIDEANAAIESVRWDKPCPICAFNNIVAVGDSLTACSTLDNDNSTPSQAYRTWPVHIQKKFGLDECLVFATGGHTSISNWNSYKEAKEHYNGPYRVPENGKTIVFIYLGTNGAVVDEWLEESAPMSEVDTFETSWWNDYTGCYCKIVQTFLNMGAVVVLVLPRGGGDGGNQETVSPETMDRTTPEGWTLEDTRRSVIAIAERFGLAYVDGLKCHSTDTIYHKFRNGEQNSVHYTDFGYIYFAEKLIYEMTNLPKELMEKAVPR